MRKNLKIRCLLILLALFWSAKAFAQPELSLNPERGFLSPNRYTNAYFGFSLPFPNLPDLQPLQPTTSQGVHTIFGLKAHDKGASTLLITAKFMANASEEDARRAATGTETLATTPYILGGLVFIKSETEQKGPAGRRRSITYVTNSRNYLLSFSIDSFDSKTAQTFERSIHSITVFSPLRALEIAGPDAQPFPNELQKAAAKRIGALDLGALSGDVYFNSALGFSFSFPQGWSVIDQPTQKKIFEAGHRAAWGNDPAAQQEHQLAEQCSRTLLYVVEPRTASGPNQSRSAEIVTAFDKGCMPEAPSFPTSPDDAEAITLIGSALMQSLSATPFRPDNNVRVLKAQEHLMIEVGGEYSFKLPGEDLTMRQNASVVMTEIDGYWILITFSGHTEARVQELIKQAKIGFTVAR